MNKEIKLSYCKYCKLPKHQCQCTSDGWSSDFKQRFDEDLQNRACEMDWRHDYYFSHYEDDRDPSSTATLLGKYAIMICRHCGHYIKQKLF